MADDKAAQDKLKADKQLEDDVKRLGDYEMHPLISKIQHRSGFFNIVRNARNQKQVDVEEILKDQ